VLHHTHEVFKLVRVGGVVAAAVLGPLQTGVVVVLALSSEIVGADLEAQGGQIGQSPRSSATSSSRTLVTGLETSAGTDTGTGDQRLLLGAVDAAAVRGVGSGWR